MYEYNVTTVDEKLDKTEKQIAHLNDMARFGWRLVTATVTVHPAHFYWEREKK